MMWLCLHETSANSSNQYLFFKCLPNPELSVLYSKDLNCVFYEAFKEGITAFILVKLPLIFQFKGDFCLLSMNNVYLMMNPIHQISSDRPQQHIMTWSLVKDKYSISLVCLYHSRICSALSLTMPNSITLLGVNDIKS